jgi:hypothetical protein
MLKKWLAEQDEAFRNEVGVDARRYMSTSCSLKELEDLDDRFINDSPEGDNDRASNGTSD